MSIRSAPALGLRSRGAAASGSCEHAFTLPLTGTGGHPRLRGAARSGSLIGVCLALPMALGGCGEETEAARPAGVLVDTTRVATEDVPRVLRAVGTVEAESQTVVKAEVEGQVARIVADEGARVNKGQMVMQIDPTTFRLRTDNASAGLAQARATLANDEKLLERYNQLLQGGAIDQQSYDDVAARVKSGRAAVEQAVASAGMARVDLGKSAVRAPFGGQVADRLVDLGAFVSIGDDLFELVDASPVRVAFDIPEADVGVLKEGDPVRFTVRTDPGQVYEGKVVYVSPALDPESRTQTLKAEYANSRAEIPPGAFADVQVTASVREDAPVIREEALVSEGDQSFVYVIQGGKAEKREVELGERLQDRLEIAKGLEGGEVVVVAGQRELSDGAQVRFAETPAAAPGELGPAKGQAR